MNYSTHQKGKLVLGGDVTFYHHKDTQSWLFAIILKTARSFGHSWSGGRQFFCLQFLVRCEWNGGDRSDRFRHFINDGFQFGFVTAGDWLSDWNGRFDDFTGHSRRNWNGRFDDVSRDSWSDWESGAG